MRELFAVAVTVAVCLSAGATAGAQGTSALGRRVASRPPLVPLRGELLQPVGPPRLEAPRALPAAAPPGQRLASPPAKSDAARPARLCPMPVARPDTTALERMPVSRRDATRPVPVPVVVGCENPLFR